MRTFLTLFLLLFSSVLSAETPKAKTPVSSAQNRANKTWQLTAGPGHVVPFFGPRVRAGLFLDADSLFFAEIGGGLSDGFTDIYSNASMSSEGRKALVGYKLFFGNTFYAEGSGFFRLVTSDPSQYRNSLAFSSRAVGAEFVIGNQWQKNRFTLGCDWIGVQAPLAVFGKRSQGDDGTEFSRRKSQDFKAFSENVQIMLLGFYLGFSL